VRPLPLGKSRHHVVVTDRGTYVLRCSYRSKTVDQIEFEHELIAYLRAHGFPAPRVAETVDGTTHVAVDGRLYRLTAFVRGSACDARSRNLEEVARTLAHYHDLAATFDPVAPTPDQARLNASLRERLATVRNLRAARFGPTDGEIEPLLEALPEALEHAEAAVAALDDLYPRLPELVIHAGCRRASALCKGDALAAMLDFDSARLEARVVDLAVALHDFAKVYGEPSSAAYKVPLDLNVVARFLAGYQDVARLLPVELEALPALLIAKRLKRAFGRYERLLAGEPLSPGDTRKIALELGRVRWLVMNAERLHAVIHVRTPPSRVELLQG
jgi:homoserine kinase type II